MSKSARSSSKKKSSSRREIPPKSIRTSTLLFLRNASGVLVVSIAVMIVLGLLTAATGTGFSRSDLPEGTSLISGEIVPFWLWVKNFDLVYYGFHRLVGLAVVVLTFTVTVGALRAALPEPSRRLIRRSAVLLLAAITVQALVGWLRYQTGSPILTCVHGTLAPGVFIAALLFAIALHDSVKSSTSKIEPAAVAENVSATGRMIRILAWVVAVCFYLLLAVDGCLRAVPPDASIGWLFWGGRVLFLLAVVASVGGLTIAAGGLRAARRPSEISTPPLGGRVLWLLLVASAAVPFTVSALWVVSWNWPPWLYDTLGLPPLRLTAGGTELIGALVVETLVALMGLATTTLYLIARRRRA